ncbi:MAG: IPT/TIG domain-containing protein [Acidobacteriota bacterium]
MFRRDFSTHVVIFAALLLGTCSSSPAGDNKWTSNGPYGGTFWGFCFDPRASNMIYASSETGLFRSRNGGTSWERLSLWNTGPTAVLRIHPSDPGRIIAAANAVYTSTDRGRSWTEICAPASDIGSDFSDFEFDPKNPQTLYAVTYCRGVIKSTDGGRTWALKNAGLDLTPVGWGGPPRIEVDPTDGKRVYVLLQSLKAYRSTSGGDSWKQVTNGLDFEIEEYGLTIDPENPRTLFASGDPGVFKTTDAGDHWTRVLDQAVRSVSLDAANTQTVYALSWDYVYKSVDGGTTWSQLLVAPRSDTAVVAVHPKKSNTVFVGGLGQGILRSQNAGKTWPFVNNGLDANPVSRIAAQKKKGGRMFAVNGWILYESTNGGNTWTLNPLSSGDSKASAVGDVQVHARNANLVVAAVGGPGTVAVSEDAGRTWRFCADYFFGRCIALDPRSENTMYVAPTKWTDTGIAALGIAKSTNRGKTWDLINRGLSDKNVSAIAIDPRNSSTLFVGTQSVVYKSTDGGGVWKKCNTISMGWPSDLEFDSTGSQTVWLATGDNRVFMTTDGGITWTRKGEGGVFVAQDPRNPMTMFTGTWGGIRVSTDHGESWSNFDSTGLGPLWSNDFLIDPSDPNRYLIATDHGVFSYTRKGSQGGPVIQQLSPGAGKAGDTVAVNGSGFGSVQGTSTVLFGALNSGVAQSWSDTSIKVTVPTGVQTGYVTVDVLGKRSNRFEFIVLPASGNVEPTSGPPQGGTRVTILAPSGTSGTQFNVLFGATVASNVRFTQPNVITCDSPPGTGTVDVKVTSSVTSTTVGTFTYE